MTLILWTLIIAILTAVACALCGTFLIVRREAFVSEGLSHAVLPGIIIAFLIFQDRSSPWLILFAALAGLLMVLIVRVIGKTNLVCGDAALGIVFSALFSIGIIIASQNLRNVHFHADCIIDGNLATAALSEFQLFGISFGPKAFVAMSLVVAGLLGFILLFYKELKLTMFDQGLAKNLGFRPTLLHIGWLSLVSVTTVVSFETAGTILVVALMIAPPAAANLLTSRFSKLLMISVLLGAISAVIGIYLGLWLDISPAGPIASTSGLLFLIVVVTAPKNGLISRISRRHQQRTKLFEQILLIELNKNQSNGLTVDELFPIAAWSQRQFDSIVERCVKRRLVTRTENRLELAR